MAAWRFLRQLFNRPLYALSSTILIVLISAAFVGPRLIAYSPIQIDLQNGLSPPSANHMLGTDELGRDILARVLQGTRLSIGIGVLAMAVASVVGTILGGLAGYLGGRVDAILMRLVDGLLSIPLIMLIVVLASIHGPSGWLVVLVVGIAGWTWTARIARGEFKRLKRTQFVQAARALGASNLRMLTRHLLPNATSPIVVNMSLGVAGVILLESAVSYLGLGVQPPQASLGSMLYRAQTYFTIAPWIALAPGILIILITLSFNILGDAVRDALDPASSSAR